MFLWCITFIALIFALFWAEKAIRPFWGEWVTLRSNVSGFEAGARILHDLSECLEAGILPTPDQWQKLNALDRRMRPGVLSSLQALRDSGAPVVPALKRFRSLCEKQSESARFASSKSFSALMQAGVVSLLVPVSAVTLYALLDSLAAHALEWAALSLGAFFWSSIGGVLILIQAERARWGGLRKPDRDLAIEAVVFSETLIAFLQAGLPGDLAWSRARSSLFSEQTPRALEVVSADVWSQANGEIKPMSGLFRSIQNSIAASLMDGRPAAERLGALLAGFENEFKALVTREIEALSVRALKPLYVFAFPAMLSLIVSALILSVSNEFSVF